jgi:AraC family transcriptional regulator of adaptative response / DNA-3-methyladenine glycosylase II
VDGGDGWIEVRPVAGRNALEARLHLASARALLGAVGRIRRVFDLDADPHSIAAAFADDPRLGPLVRRRPGLRVPGAWDGFELAVRAILGQQVTVKGATSLAGRLVRAHGTVLPPNGGDRPAVLSHRFPDAATLARADLRAIGVPRRRAEALSALARAVADGAISLDGGADPDATLARFAALPGIGPWTAQYVAMRALREPDAFPADDLGVRAALAGRRGARPTGRVVARMAESWRPWRAYAVMHLWSTLAGGKERKR